MIKTLGKSALIVVLGISVSGCAQRASSIEPEYVSPITYEKYSCGKLHGEMNRVAARVKKISDNQDGLAVKDAMVTTVGALVFLPALVFLAAGDDHKPEIARLKGEYKTIREVAQKKQCRWARDLPPLK